MNAKQQFTETFARENATTRRVLHSLPASKADFQPYPDARSARQLAFLFSFEQGNIAAALSSRWQFPPSRPSVPATYTEVLASFDATSAAVHEALAHSSDARLDEMVQFFAGPKQVSNITVGQLIWFMLLDGVHHRGQFSVYLRAAGEKVPSIYGPSAAEPWT